MVPAELERIEKQLGVDHLYDDYHTMLEQDIDAVVLASPVQFHVDQLISALEAGKHVFCEKPLGVDIADCRRALSTTGNTPDKRLWSALCAALMPHTIRQSSVF